MEFQLCFPSAFSSSSTQNAFTDIHPQKDDYSIFTLACQTPTKLWPIYLLRCRWCTCNIPFNRRALSRTKCIFGYYTRMWIWSSVRMAWLDANKVDGCVARNACLAISYYKQTLLHLGMHTHAHSHTRCFLTHCCHCYCCCCWLLLTERHTTDITSSTVEWNARHWPVQCVKTACRDHVIHTYKHMLNTRFNCMLHGWEHYAMILLIWTWMNAAVCMSMKMKVCLVLGNIYSRFRKVCGILEYISKFYGKLIRVDERRKCYENSSSHPR